MPNFYLSEPDARSFHLTQVSEHPRIYLVHNFLSHIECNQIIEAGRPKLRPSTVVDNDNGADVLHSNRTSSGGFFNHGENPLIQLIENRIEKLTNIPLEHGEGIQILNYLQDQTYRPHFDYFDPKQPGSHVHLRRGGQRVATLITYLNDVQAGGETCFPEACIKVMPKKGMGVLFYNCTKSGVEDPKTLHGGDPVIAGEKWIITKWIREGKFVEAAHNTLNHALASSTILDNKPAEVSSIIWEDA